jgi:hypothetical protein
MVDLIRYVGNKFTLVCQFHKLPLTAKPYIQVAAPEGISPPQANTPDGGEQMRPLKVDGAGKATVEITPTAVGLFRINSMAWSASGTLLCHSPGRSFKVVPVPTIKSFTVDRPSVKVGEQYTLSWEIADWVSAEATPLKIEGIENPGWTRQVAAESISIIATTPGKIQVRLVVTPQGGESPPAPVQSQQVEVEIRGKPTVDHWPEVFQKRPGLKVKMSGNDRTGDMNAMCDGALPDKVPHFGGNFTDMAKVEKYDGPAPEVREYALDLRAEINENRKRIPPRPIQRDPINKHGNAYSRDWDSTPQAKESKDRKIARPTNCPAPSAGQTVPEFHTDYESVQSKWQIFELVMPAEGTITSFSAFGPDPNVTFGPGFCTTGLGPQKILHEMLAQGGHLQATALAVGLTTKADPANAGKFMFVVADTTTDPTLPCLLEGRDAELYIGCNLELLSFIANLCIGAQPAIPNAAGFDGRAQEQLWFDTLWALACDASYKGCVATLPRTGHDKWAEALACHTVHAGSAYGPISIYKDQSTVEAVANKMWEKVRAYCGFPSNSKGDHHGPLSAYNIAKCIASFAQYQQHWWSIVLPVLQKRLGEDCKKRKSDGKDVEVPPPANWPWKDAAEDPPV